MNMEELLAIAVRMGFLNPNLLLPLAREAILLTPNGSSGEDERGSRLGGRPALPAEMPWPTWRGRSLSFVAQIDLEAQARVAALQGFPDRGRLLFFYDAEQSTWGFDPKDAGSFAVIYATEPDGPLANWPEDLPDEARFPACGLKAEAGLTLPPAESVLVEDLHLSPHQRDSYFDLVHALSSDDSWGSRGLLGGHPDQIQGDMMLECELVTNNLYCGDATGYRDSRLPMFRKQARNWRLLLQVPSADAAEMMWGDMGCLYYWIREEDLNARRFERSWMILQCG